MMNKIKKQIFLGDLPKGRNILSGATIAWRNSIGCKVSFIYGDIRGEVKIVDYKDEFLFIKYLDKELYKISHGSFSRCMLGRLVGSTTSTSEFKVKAGTIFKDTKRDITVTGQERRIRHDKNDRIYNEKGYNYTCNKCGKTNGWMTESCLLKGIGCTHKHKK